MSDEMKTALEKIGMYDFVMAAGTWAVRIKEFFKGMLEGAKEAFSFVMPEFKGLRDMLMPFFQWIGEALASLGISIKGNTSEISKWAEAGKWLMKVALIPIKLVIWNIITTMKILITVITWVVDAIKWLADGVVWLWEAGINMGSGLVDGIVEGVKGAWEFLKSTLLTLIDSLPFAEEIADFFGIGGGGGQMQLAGPGAGGSSRIGEAIANNNAMQYNLQPTVVREDYSTVDQITNVVNLDGEKIYNNVEKRSKRDNGRS